MIDTLKELFLRDLRRVKKQLNRYQDDSALWDVTGEVSNSGGNLCLHLAGNIKTYIGNGLASTAYERDREWEFSAKNVDKQTLHRHIDEAMELVQKGFEQLSTEDMTKDFPMLIWEEPRPMEFTLLHLYSHLNYHLGQIDYHRRVLDKAI